MDILSLLIIIVVGGLLSGLVIWVVSKLGLGLEVDGFASAFLAAIIIAMVGGLVEWLLSSLGITFGGGWLGAIAHFFIGAIVLLISDRLLEGLRVAGFGGALVGALAIAVIDFLLGLLLATLLV